MPRALSIREKSSSAMTTPGSSPPSARISPQGGHDQGMTIGLPAVFMITALRGATT